MKQCRVFLVLLLVIVLTIAFSGCEKSYKAKQPEKVAAAEKADQERKKAEKVKADDLAKKAKEEVKKAVQGDIDCWGKEDPKAPKVEFAIGEKKYEITGAFSLKALNADAAKPLVFGVLTDIKTNIPKNMDNLKAFFADFKKAGATAVLVTGDLAENYESAKAIFDLIGEQGMLAMFIMGNRDKKEDYTHAFDDSNKTYKNIVNMNRVRMANLGAVTVLSLPGYYDTNYIHHQPGCHYSEEQVNFVKNLAARATNPVLLISHGPPRGVGKEAIDMAVEAGNVGDPKMAWLINEAKIPFGSFGNIHEAGGKAVGADFKTVLKPGAMHDKLYLNPGPADSDPWNLNSGEVSKGMAAILSIKGGKASYKILKAK